MVQLYDDERLDHLLAENLRIIQSPSVFAFSLDTVLLARFVYVPIQKGKIIDLCTGNGVIPLLLSRRSKAEITGVENAAHYNVDKPVSVEIRDVNLDVNRITVTRNGRGYNAGGFGVANQTAPLSHNFSQ
ncbi:hypothetical protein NXY55_24355, partial [Aeromonas veronii]|nr:hypothetical protein [Aeromonas veronii]